jgi:hypothetical protein
MTERAPRAQHGPGMAVVLEAAASESPPTLISPTLAAAGAATSAAPLRRLLVLAIVGALTLSDDWVASPLAGYVGAWMPARDGVAAPAPPLSPEKPTSPVLLVSLLFNEDPEWLAFHLDSTADALGELAGFYIVISTSPEKLAGAKAAAEGSRAAGRVHFSSPFSKAIVGYDFLRGLHNNLEYALSHPVLSRAVTHVVLLSSNAMFIRHVQPASLLAAASNPLAGRYTLLEIDNTWVWSPAVRADICYPAWVRTVAEKGQGKAGESARSSAFTLRHGQWEGAFGTLRAWSLLHPIIALFFETCPAPEQDNHKTPGEEVVLSTAIALLLGNRKGPLVYSRGQAEEERAEILALLDPGAVAFGFVAHMYWERDDGTPTFEDLAQSKEDPGSPLAVKRVERNRNSERTQLVVNLDAAARPEMETILWSGG